MGKYSLEIALSIAPTDSNKILGRSKFAKHSVFKNVKTEVMIACHRKKPEAPLERFTIKAERLAPRFLDFDNLVSSLKPYIDGLKLAGIIVDDTYDLLNHTNYFPVQTKSKERKIIIRVSEE